MSETDLAPQFCGQCGRPLADSRHDACGLRATLEPPRYCAYCARRMVVQVTPTGWAARCSRHGVLASQGPSDLELDDEALG